ncbi:MAG: ATP-binding protein [Sphingomonadaceae bacterium]|nr:ATP-binding protein [Sphingomonadaceae bacterium]
MLVVAALWIATLLLIGGFALDRVLTSSIARNFDGQLNYALTAMIAAAEIGPEGEVRLTRALVDQRFDQPYSGLYYQVSGGEHEPFRSRSLWDRALKPDLTKPDLQIHAYTSFEFPSEPLRVVERDVTLPGSPVGWRFQVAESTLELEEQVARLRGTLTWSLSILGFGLFILAVLQAAYGLWPLRRVSRSIVAIRSGSATRIPTDFPPEIAPLVVELNALLEHNERQAEEARTHAGNLAHALKTPMSVLTNEAAARTTDLPEAVLRETATMRRHVDHHLARARAIGRRGASTARAPVWPSLEALRRAIERIHGQRDIVIDISGNQDLAFCGERQDLEEMLGNLLDNAAKYGGGRVFVSVERVGGNVAITVEDDGPGIPAPARAELFQRGARLDTSKPGTGLGLAIVRDVAEIYGGSVELGESEDLGGLSVTLRLPAATS